MEATPEESCDQVIEDCAEVLTFVFFSLNLLC